jgi:spore germination cell wall hydrolase CwlJ-like protein
MKALLLPLLLTYPLMATGAPLTAPVGAERALIAAVIIAEAGGEADWRRGTQAVWEVIHNRAAATGRTYTQVVTRRSQFSCLNNTTPARLGQRMSQHRWYGWVHEVLLRTTPRTNLTRGANHYHAGRQPYWARGRRGIRIGHHRFYRL